MDDRCCGDHPGAWDTPALPGHAWCAACLERLAEQGGCIGNHLSGNMRPMTKASDPQPQPSPSNPQPAPGQPNPDDPNRPDRPRQGQGEDMNDAARQEMARRESAAKGAAEGASKDANA